MTRAEGRLGRFRVYGRGNQAYQFDTLARGWTEWTRSSLGIAYE